MCTTRTSWQRQMDARYGDDAAIDRDYMRKYGHPFEKPYCEEDVGAYVFPERDNLCGYGLMLYKRYQASRDKTHCWMSFCSCNPYDGQLCTKCQELNTSDFYGLKVPLCPEDMTALYEIFAKEGWKVPQVYQWVHFWIREYGKYVDCRIKKFVFWHYMDQSVHKFFRYLFDFVKAVTNHDRGPYISYHWDIRPNFIVDGPRSAKVKMPDAALKLSMEVYGRGEEFHEMESVVRKRLEYTKVSWGPMCSLYEERLEQQSRKIFRGVLEDIDNEVAFRPGRVGMEEACEDFLVRCG